MSHRYHLGLNMGHERSVAIVRNGKLEVAIEQERLDRNKFSLGYLLQSPGDIQTMQIPLEAIRYCLDACQITLGDVASITANMPGEDKAPDILKRSLPPEFCDRIQQVPSHHLAHAYSAYTPSGFDEALIWVADASGSTQDHQTESYSLYLGQGNHITPLHQEKIESHLSGLATLGFIYEYITKEAGFVTQVSDHIKHAEAGKLMGLAPFGGPQPNWHRWIKTRPDSYSLDISPYDIFLEVEAIKKHYGQGAEKPYLRNYMVDLAYKVQQELEQAIQHIIHLAIQRTGVKKLCIAGGIGLNSVVNYKLLHKLKLDNIFVFPAAGDSGIAAGCAYWAYHTLEAHPKRVPLYKADLGRSYDNTEIEAAIAQFSNQISVNRLSDDDILERSATALSQGSIIARYEGGSEFGPRALGQRSILADPTFRKMKDIINARVKFREAFRPFAPVIPLEAMSEVFEQEVAAPFMLLVPKIKDEFHHKIPAVTHVDGTGRVQSVTAEHNPFFHQLCYRLVEKRSGPPVLLNTSFNVAGQPIVETPAEAIATFLRADIDFLAIGSYWIAKQHVPVLNYDDHLSKVQPSPTPKGLTEEAPEVTDLMRSLDRSIFFEVDPLGPWSSEEIQQLSAKIAQYKETSHLFPEHPYGGQLKTRLSPDIILLLDPHGMSHFVHRARSQGHYKHSQIKLLLTVLQGNEHEIDQLRREMRMTQREFDGQKEWAIRELATYSLSSATCSSKTLPIESPIPQGINHIFEPFQDPTFSVRTTLWRFYQLLNKASYSAPVICQRLQLESLQQLQPTHLHYYDRHRLNNDDLSDLIRLFQLRVALPTTRMVELFGTDLFESLCRLRLFIPRGKEWASQVDIFDVEGLFIATDHRYMLLEEDQNLDESPVMYIGMDSIGLVHTAPQYNSEGLLDLCCGSGVQGLFATRYARTVIGVDINPRAIRFSRFNAQLNGIENIEFRQGNLYEAVKGQLFNIILANPPFVPSPSQDFKFRDGGANGEEILTAIIQGSADHLCPRGKLHIVTDLVDVDIYEHKLQNWWQGNPCDLLVLGTADRDDILFSVPHSHAAFGQTYQHYCHELEQWLNNFHQANLTAVNFGYILLHLNPTGTKNTYHYRTIHNPQIPIHAEVKQHFIQRQRLNAPSEFQLQLSENINIRTEWRGETTQFELFSSDNPYFTTYPISYQVFMMLQDIIEMQPLWKDYVNLANQAMIRELVFKGILDLQLSRRTRTQSSLRLAGRSALAQLPSLTQTITMHRDRTEHMALSESVICDPELSIGELQTKTTPTCLSSYL